MMAGIPVMEIFGPTIQGEGMAIGRKTMFVRTGGCDYRCTWCDSKFTWDGTEKAAPMTPEQVWQELARIGGDGFDYVTISGGNPALVKDPMGQLVTLLHAQGIRVGVETQGSVWQDWLLAVDDVTLSPKPPSSGMNTEWDVLGAIVHRLQQASVNTSCKVVVFDDADYEYAKSVHRRWPELPLYLSVGNPDVNRSGDVSRPLLDRLLWLVEKVTADASLANVRVLPQLHVLLWGNRRGV